MTLLSIDPRFQSGLTPEQYTKLIESNPPHVGEGGMFFTGAVRLSYPHLKEPTSYKGGAPKYQASGLFTHNHMKPLVEYLKAAARRFYPDVTDPGVFINPRAKDGALRDQGNKVNVKDGGHNAIDKTLGGYVPGFMFIAPKSGKAVPCFHFMRGKIVAALPEEIEQIMYPGCWVSMKLNAFKSSASGNPGPVLGLQGLTKLADDRSFEGGGGGASAEDFSGAVAIEDPNANGVVPSDGKDYSGADTGAAADYDWG